MSLCFIFMGFHFLPHAFFEVVAEDVGQVPHQLLPEAAADFTFRTRVTGNVIASTPNLRRTCQDTSTLSVGSLRTRASASRGGQNTPPPYGLSCIERDLTATFHPLPHFGGVKPSQGGHNHKPWRHTMSAATTVLMALVSLVHLTCLVRPAPCCTVALSTVVV